MSSLMIRRGQPWDGLARALISKVGLLLLVIGAVSQLSPADTKGFFTKISARKAAQIKASFLYNPRYPSVGQLVNFIDTSSGVASARQWEFGDGVVSDAQNPVHVYETPGFYKVTLSVHNGETSKKTIKTLTVMPAQSKASFVYSPRSPKVGDVVQFADTSPSDSDSWSWDFGDGSTSTVKNPSHSYRSASVYTVTLTTIGDSGSAKTSQALNVVSTATVSASFSYSPSSPITGQDIQFTDSSTGSPTSWRWEFGDGQISSVRNPSHAYSAAGTYIARLTASNDTGSNSQSRTITVTPVAALQASFTYNPESPVAGQSIQFTDTSTGSPQAWHWDFNDGITSSSQHPRHSFSVPGSYNVTLTVTNNTGSISTSRTITVASTETLAADFAYEPSAPTIGQTVSFLDKSTGNPTSWQWDFGDGATSSIKDPDHVYSSVGSYNATLTITSGANSSSISRLVSISHTDAIVANSPNYSDVSFAVSIAASGDTVIVPAGSATWEAQLIINKGIILKGAGIDQTIIKSNSASGGAIIVYNPASPELNESFRLTGFTFDGGNKGRLLLIENKSLAPIRRLRIDHNKFINSLGNMILIKGTVYGVCDNNQIIHTPMPRSQTMDHLGLNANSWANTTFNFGTEDNLYWEDNEFTLTDIVTAAGHGGRYCFRHNLINYINTSHTMGAWDAHGNQPGSIYATMGTEIYENTIYSSVGVTLIDHRGGKALAYNNNIVTSASVSAKCREEYNDSICQPATNPISGQPQHVSDSYYWGNRRNGTTVISTNVAGTVDYGGEKGPVPQENREYWNENPNFIGSSGIGIGLLANRPINCSIGTAYWATDTKTLYKCLATNAWTTYYKPYTYPHPLRTALSD